MKVLISFDLSNVYVGRIRGVSPSLEVVQSEGKEDALRLIEDTDVLLAGFFSRELFLAARRLKWIQAWGAGVDRFLFPEVVDSPVTLTCRRRPSYADLGARAWNYAVLLSEAPCVHQEPGGAKVGEVRV